MEENIFPTDLAIQGSRHRKRERTKLPCVVLVYDRVLKVISGATLVCDVFSVPGSSTVQWNHTRATKLQNDDVVTPQIIKYSGDFFLLHPGSESAVRLAPALCGGMLSDHFQEHLDNQWRVLTIDPGATDMARAYLEPTRIFSFITKRGYADHLGVKPTTVQAYVAPSNQEDVDLQMHAEIEQERPESHDAGGVAHGPAVVAPKSMALQRLESNYVTQSQGTVTHRYTPASLLRYLELARHVRPNHSLEDVVTAAAGLLLPEDESESLDKALHEKQVHLPSIDLMRFARQRLDLLSVLWNQRTYLIPNEIWFQLTDASPQSGVNFLATIRDTFVIPTAAQVSICNTIVELRLDDKYRSELELLSTIGRGKAGLIKKTRNVVNLVLMTCGTDERFHADRKACRGNVTDQGTETGINDESIEIIQRYQDKFDKSTAEAYIYPNSLNWIGNLHVLYDALEVASKKNPTYKEFQDNVRELLAFVTDKDLMEQFKAHCCGELVVVLF